MFIGAGCRTCDLDDIAKGVCVCECVCVCVCTCDSDDIAMPEGAIPKEATV
jgi:hypothetical protein